MKLLVLIVLSAMLWVAPANAEQIAGPVSARVVEIVDGDTFVVLADVWLGQTVRATVRLEGIDAPELRGRCAREKALAGAARELLDAVVQDRQIYLYDIRYGKYAGRVVARPVSAAGEDIASLLVAQGLARPYDGGARAGWCDPAAPAAAD